VIGADDIERCLVPEPNHILFEDGPLAGVGFLLPCKSGNTSVKWALWRALGMGPPPENIHAADLFPYASVERISMEADTIVGLIRDPWERVGSQYNYLAPKGMTFPAWMRKVAKHPDYVADQHERSQWWDLQWGGQVLPDIWITASVRGMRACVAAIDQMNTGASEDVGALIDKMMDDVRVTNTLEDNGITRRPIDELFDDGEARSAFMSRYGHDLLLYEHATSGGQATAIQRRSG